MERITSIQNPLIKHIRRLQTDHKYREKCMEFVADGFKLLDEALKWYPHIKTVLVVDDYTLPELPEEARIVSVPQSLMQSLSEMKTPQGVLFTCSLPQQRDPVLRGGMLLLDRIQDPGNLGTILRTADAFSVPVVLTNGCADAYSLKTIRASMGAVFRDPPRYCPLDRVLSLCREQGIPLAATALTPNAKDISSLNLKEYLIVIGSEGQGVCGELLAASQEQMIIPMNPRCESLNAAVAAAIVMWQLR